MAEFERESISYQSGGKTYNAYAVRQKESRSSCAVIIAHEIWGLNDDIRNIADKFATLGYLALAPDLYPDREPPAKIDEAVIKEVLDGAFAEDTLRSLHDAVGFLGKRFVIAPRRTSMAGFCFGGTYALQYVTEFHDLAAAVAFYGRNPPIENVPDVVTPVLAFYGAEDRNLVPGIPALTEAFKNAHAYFEVKVYEGAGHSFMNKHNPGTYVEDAADDAWIMTQAFLKEHLPC